MDNIGQSKSRNLEFQEKFSRERLLQRLLGSTAPVIFDIGAHRGESVVFLKGVFPQATIHSFEPDPDSYKVLSAAAIPGVSYHNLALSDADGTMPFYRNKISHTNSLLKVNLSSRDSIGIAKATAEKDAKYFERFNEEVQVTTTRLDSFAQQHVPGPIDLLKIDVQGAECRVLAGGEATCRRTKAIILEINFFDYYEHQSSFMEVERIIAPLGFRLFSISEISNNPMNGRTDWAEVVYLNHRLTRGGKAQ